MWISKSCNIQHNSFQTSHSNWYGGRDHTQSNQGHENLAHGHQIYFNSCNLLVLLVTPHLLSYAVHVITASWWGCVHNCSLLVRNNVDTDCEALRVGGCAKRSVLLTRQSVLLLRSTLQSMSFLTIPKVIYFNPHPAPGPLQRMTGPACKISQTWRRWVYVSQISHLAAKTGWYDVQIWSQVFWVCAKFIKRQKKPQKNEADISNEGV